MTRKLLLLAMLLAPLSQAETLIANFRYIWANNGTVPLGAGPTCSTTTSVCAYWEAADSDNPSVAQTMMFCWSDSYIPNITQTDALWSNGNCQTTLTRVTGTSAFSFIACTTCGAAQYAFPAPGVAVGSITPSDGNTHYLYFKILSPTSSPANDHVGDSTPIAYKYALSPTGNPSYKLWPSTVPATPTPLTASDFVAVGNVSDTYSVGVSSGATWSCAVSWGSQSGATIYNTGALGYWMQKHSVPCDSGHVALTALTVTQIVASSTPALATLLSDIAATGRQAVAIGWAQPSVVTGGATQQGMSSYLAYGGVVPGNPFSDSTQALSPNNPYFNLATNTPFTTSGIRISMMLAAGHCVSTCVGGDITDPNYPTAVWAESVSDFQVVVDAAVAAYGTKPTTGKVGMPYTAFTTGNDKVRVLSIVPFIFTGLGTPSPVNPTYIASATIQGFNASGAGTGSNNVATYCSGTTNLLCAGADPQVHFTNAAHKPFLPGAGIGINVSSSGADIPTDTVGQQSTMLGWINHGAVAAMGSATEPGQVPLHFPDYTILLENYTKGRTVVEAMWGSVRLPWTDNFAGDPLANPFASASVPVVSTGTAFRGVTLRGVTAR